MMSAAMLGAAPVPHAAPVESYAVPAAHDDPTWSHAGTSGPVRREQQVLINGRDLLPAETGDYRDKSSLTSPPCSAAVNSFVTGRLASLSQAQLERFPAPLAVL